MKVDSLKEISIEDYLSKRGFHIENRGRLKYCLSPFSEERTPSFCIYPTNTFYDWANGIGGDIIKLVMEMEGLSFKEATSHLSVGNFSILDIKSIREEPPKKKFILENYTTDDPYEMELISRYAYGRGIVRNFAHSAFYIYHNGDFIRRPAMGFVHVDENLNVCGVKMRDLKPFNGRRFSARGLQKYYIISNCVETNSLYIVESESSANSLLDFMSIIGFKSTIVSFGSWNNIPRELPEKLEKANRRSIIIDYDGDEDLYNEKMERFGHFNAREVKLRLPKGEDVNSLYTKGALYMYKNLIL